MSYTPLTKNGVDTATPLDFPDRRPARQELTIAITAVVNGFTTEITFSGHLDQLDALTKKLLAMGASPQGTSKVLAPSAGPLRKSAAVTYADDGTPVCGNANCSRHGQPLEPSQHNGGHFCKGKDTVSGNSKGYCKTVS